MDEQYEQVIYTLYSTTFILLLASAIVLCFL